MRQDTLACSRDLWRAATPNGDLVTELAKAVSQFRLIYGRWRLLRGEEAWAEWRGVGRCRVRHVEDDGMGVELRSNVTIDRAGGVVFELGGNEFSRGFGRMVAANAVLSCKFSSCSSAT